MTATLAPIEFLSFRDLRKAESNSVLRAEATLSEPRPAWLDAVARKCASFVDLENNWDSYGGRPVHESVAQATSELLLRLARASSPAPTVVPTARGGIQLEWHTPSVELEIDIASPGRLSAIFENRETGEEWEREFQSDLSQLVNAIAQLPAAR
jgi:hypothetical protein